MLLADRCSAGIFAKTEVLCVICRREVLAAIENISLEVTRSVAQGEAPCLSYTRRDAWENVMWVFLPLRLMSLHVCKCFDVQRVSVKTNFFRFRFVEGLGLQMIDDGSQTHVKFDSIVSVNKFGAFLHKACALQSRYGKNHADIPSTN